MLLILFMALAFIFSFRVHYSVAIIFTSFRAHYSVAILFTSHQVLFKIQQSNF